MLPHTWGRSRLSRLALCTAKSVQQLQTYSCDAMFGGELVARNCLAPLRVLGAGHTALSSPSSASAHTSF